MKSKGLFSMFSKVVLMGLFISVNAFAELDQTEPEMMLSCSTAPKTTRSVVLKHVEDKVSFQYYQNKDFSETQLMFGGVYKSDVKKLEKLQGLINSVGRNLQLDFPVDKCKMSGVIFHCDNYHGTPVSLGGHQVMINSIMSEMNVSLSVYGQHVLINVYLNMTVDGEDFFMPLTYQKEECSFYDPQQVEGAVKSLEKEYDRNQI